MDFLNLVMRLLIKVFFVILYFLVMVNFLEQRDLQYLEVVFKIYNKIGIYNIYYVFIILIYLKVYIIILVLVSVNEDVLYFLLVFIIYSNELKFV